MCVCVFGLVKTKVRLTTRLSVDIALALKSEWPVRLVVLRVSLNRAKVKVSFILFLAFII